MSNYWLEKINKKQALCYDPDRKKFIKIKEIISGKEKIIDINILSDDDKKLLVLQRLMKGPDFSMQSISGGVNNKEDIIKAIVQNEEIGKMTIEAEISMLKDLLKAISSQITK